MSRQFGWMFKLASLLFASALFIATLTPSWASAQSTEDPWTDPVNLSHSGVAVTPSIVVDANGVVHAVWQDDARKFIYTRFDGSQWSEPKTTAWDLLFSWDPPLEDVPAVAVYTGLNPFFITGPGEYIFAFWVTPQGGLLTSKVRSEDFGDRAWEYARLITSGAGSFAVAVDASGDWHLAYLRRIEDHGDPVGIYYTRSRNGGLSWTVPVLLYESSYLHALGEGEGNLGLAIGGTEEARHIYIAWDNRLRKQVFLAQSADGGQSWESPMLVAGPVQDAGAPVPFNIRVGANQDSVVLVWQSGQPGGTCSQLYQYSTDAGVTWSDPEPMMKELPGCAKSNEFVTELANSPEGPLYLMTETQSQVFLSAWNGLQWSQSQSQSVLSGFEEPEIYTQVMFGCYRGALLGEQLFIVGCDEGQGGDVWVTSRDVGSNTAWSKTPEWSQLSPVTSDVLEMESVELVSTDDGLIHAFFSQHQDPAVYYANWEGELWSRITPVLKLPDGDAGWPAIAAGPGNQLFLIAPNNKGGLYFSRAISGGALLASSWSKPTRLEVAQHGEIGSVDVAWDAAGTLYVVYSVPVNEQRGIYLVLSKDHGANWSEPVKLFDGAAAGFDFVGAPSLLASTDELLHVTWKVESIAGNGVPQPLSLYYAQSEDGGQTFSNAEPVVEKPVAWREIVTDDKGNFHLLWQPQELSTVWDQVSSDGGHTWQHPNGLPDAGKLAVVTKDTAGQLHLVGVGPDTLGHWRWSSDRWQSELSPSWDLSLQQENPVKLLAAAVNKQGKLMVVLLKLTSEGDIAGQTLLYTTRDIDLPTKLTPNQEDTTATLVSPTLTLLTSTPEPAPTLASTAAGEPTNSQIQTDRTESNRTISPFAIALVPVALLLLGVLGLAIRQAARTQDK